MEKHKCKLCFRNFSNGRALGGHMRSHMVNLPVPPKPEPPLAQLSFEADSSPSSSSSSSSDEEEDDDKALCYGLRENPKRSFRLVDPHFSFPVEAASVILQDRESETESSKNPTRRRSKGEFNNDNQFHHLQKKMKPSNDHHHHKNKNESSSWVEPEPVSSISDATTEEDVAFCLMMLSRDEWKRQEEKDEEEEEDDEEEDEEEEEEEEEDEEEEDDDGERSVEDSDEFYEGMKSSKARSVRGRYKCETCKKVFRSYQALGGHRASHKKIRAVAICDTDNNSPATAAAAEKKIHECPVCFRVFASGQALGGHKRTHVTGSATSVVQSTPSTTTTKFGDNNKNINSLIDLNLPAPVDEEDETSQIENSAVSDSGFFKPSSQIIEAQV
ncbi:hypothetical protein QN277_022916 [Acacia crassicarpa]|uniref:C2H2-type domain-containing protein n=1 Tax=Acacia crassicarpa TaxID=499986 RepID=A0AAE1JK24_9FABA|nr:hypothetical protein QN277_022916 [Acacia crassicarpa]